MNARSIKKKLLSSETKYSASVRMILPQKYVQDPPCEPLSFDGYEKVMEGLWVRGEEDQESIRVCVVYTSRELPEPNEDGHILNFEGKNFYFVDKMEGGTRYWEGYKTYLDNKGETIIENLDISIVENWRKYRMWYDTMFVNPMMYLKKGQIHKNTLRDLLVRWPGRFVNDTFIDRLSSGDYEVTFEVNTYHKDRVDNFCKSLARAVNCVKKIDGTKIKIRRYKK